MVFIAHQYNFGRPPRVRQVAPDQTSGGSVGSGTRRDRRKSHAM